MTVTPPAPPVAILKFVDPLVPESVTVTLLPLVPITVSVPTSTLSAVAPPTAPVEVNCSVPVVTRLSPTSSASSIVEVLVSSIVPVPASILATDMASVSVM